MTFNINSDLRQVWKELKFDLDKEIPYINYEYKHLGYGVPQIFTEWKQDLAQMIENIFYQFMIARFSHLFQFQNNDIINTSDRAIKDAYNKFFLRFQHHQKQNINTVFVVTAVIVGRIVEKIIPNVIYNKRFTIQILHCILFCTMGIIVGDNCAKYIIGNALGHQQMTRFLFRKMFEEKILIAKIKQIQDEKQWPELKKLFYDPPPPPPQKIPFDEQPPQVKNDSQFVRGLKKYNLKSTQLSRAFSHENNSFIVKQNSLKKYPCKMNVSLECQSYYYKPIKRLKPSTPQKIKKQSRRQSVKNKKSLKYWEQYVLDFKNVSDSNSTKQKFPPIIRNDEISAEAFPSEVAQIIPKQKHLVQDVRNYKEFPKLQIRVKNNDSNYSVHQKKQCLSLYNSGQKEAKSGKHYHKVGRTTHIKNQSKKFHVQRLRTGDDYDEALQKQFYKLSLIR